jgi:phage shock protein C
MYCTSCGVQMRDDNDNFCARCGHPTPQGAEARWQSHRRNRLYRLAYDRKIAGVCSGLAEYLEVDVTLVRLLFAAVIVCTGGVALFAYIAACFIMPVDHGPAPLRTPASASTPNAV